MSRRALTILLLMLLLLACGVLAYIVFSGPREAAAIPVAIAGGLLRAIWRLYGR